MRAFAIWAFVMAHDYFGVEPDRARLLTFMLNSFDPILDTIKMESSKLCLRCKFIKHFRLNLQASSLHVNKLHLSY